MRHLAQGLAVALTLALPTLAWAQDAQDAKERLRAEDAQQRSRAVEALKDTPATRAGDAVAPLNAFSIEASQDATTASFKIGGVSNWILSDPSTKKTRGEFTTYSATFSAPIDKDSGHTSFATQDGFTKAASLALHVSRLVVPAVSNWGDAGLDGVPCTTMAAKFKEKHPLELVPACDGANILKYTDDLSLVRLYENAADEAVNGRGALGLIGIFGKVGYEELKYYDGSTLAKTELERTPWQVGAYFAQIDGGGDWSWTAEFVHEVSYKEDDAKTACLAGAGPVLSCETGALTRPKETEKDTLSLEGRWMPFELDLGYGSFRAGIAPKVAYDANNDDLALSFPVFLFGDKTGLTGGVRADWNSDDHDIVVGLFVTKSLKVMPSPGP